MKVSNYLRFSIGLLLLLFILLIPTTSLAESGETYEVDTNTLQVRSEPAIDAKVIAVLNKGNTLKVFQEKYGWVQTYYGGQVAWVAKHHLIPMNNPNINHTNPNSEALSSKVTVTSTSVNIRSGPSIDQSIIGSTSAGSTYDLVDTSGDWYKILLGNGSTGWIASWLTDASSSNTAVASEQAASKSLEGYTIVVDPGHGGKDPGAIGLDGIYEKDVILSTATKVVQQLRQAGANVIETRSKDSHIGLHDRTDISNATDTSAFISLHYDAYPLSSIQGVGTYYASDHDKQLADEVQSTLASTVDLQNRGIMQGNYRVLTNTNAPSILVELGFLTNLNDLSIVKTADYQSNVAQAITKGLVDYFHQ